MPPAPWRYLLTVALIAWGTSSSILADPSTTELPLPEGFWLNVYQPQQFAFERAWRRGQQALERDRFVEALGAFEEATRLDPSHEEARYDAGTLALRLKRYPQALTHFEALRRLARTQDDQDRADRRFDVCWFLAMTRTHLGDLRGALGEYDICLRVMPKHGDRHLTLLSKRAELLMALEDLDGAVAGFERVLAIRPHEAQALFGLAVALERRGDHPRARRVLRQALLEDPGLQAITGTDALFVPEGELQFYLGFTLEELGRVPEARFRYRRFLERLPDSPYRSQAHARLEALTDVPSALIAHFPTPSSDVTAAVVDPDLKVLVMGTLQGRIVALDLVGKRVMEARLDGPPVVDLAMTSDRREVRVLLNNGDVLRFDPWRGMTRLGVWQVEGMGQRFHGLCADGSVVVASRRGQFTLHRLNQPHDVLAHEHFEHPNAMLVAAIDPERRFLVTYYMGARTLARSFDVHRGVLHATLPHIAGVRDIEVFPDASGVVLGGTGGVALVAADGTLRRLLLPPDEGVVQAISLDVSGRYLTLVLNTTVQVWDLSRLDVGVLLSPEGLVKEAPDAVPESPPEVP